LFLAESACQKAHLGAHPRTFYFNRRIFPEDYLKRQSGGHFARLLQAVSHAPNAKKPPGAMLAAFRSSESAD
jgi:hypothetical protein